MLEPQSCQDLYPEAIEAIDSRSLIELGFAQLIDKGCRGGIPHCPVPYHVALLNLIVWLFLFNYCIQKIWYSHELVIN